MADMFDLEVKGWKKHQGVVSVEEYNIYII